MMLENALTDRFDQLDEPALGSCSRIGVDQPIAGGLVDRLLSDPEFGLCFRGIPRLDRLSDTPNLSAEAASSGPVSEASCFVLAKSLLGAGGIWHGDGVVGDDKNGSKFG